MLGGPRGPRLTEENSEEREPLEVGECVCVTETDCTCYSNFIHPFTTVVCITSCFTLLLCSEEALVCAHIDFYRVTRIALQDPPTARTNTLSVASVSILC